MKRRLAAIQAVDAVGCSCLFDADEAGALTASRALKKDLVEPALKSHGGRGVTLMGLIAILVILLLIAGCTYERGDPYRDRSMALIIVEDWKFQAEKKRERGLVSIIIICSQYPLSGYIVIPINNELEGYIKFICCRK